MNKVTLCENALDPESWTEHHVEDVCAFLSDHFGTWPKTARIYHQYVAESADVTPFDEATVERIGKLTGSFYVVIYPEGIEAIFIIIAIAVAAVALVASFLLRPKIPDTKNQQQQSPNNELTDRQNRERPNERIPDIFGKVWSTPDLIAVPYRLFESGVEIEYAYMCIGRGYYTVHQVRDDLTPVIQISGCSVEIYGPNTSPNNSTMPQVRIGAAISTPIYEVKPYSSVNGQTLIAPNLAGGGAWIGPVLVGNPATTQVWLNFVAESGIYSIDSTTGVQTARSVSIEVGVTPTDAAGNALGAEVLTTITLNGSATSKDRVGATLKITLSTVGYATVRAHRTSNTIISSNTSVSDETKWRDLMSANLVTKPHFGNVTTVQSKTLPTPDALALKERKLNLLVTRNVLEGTLSGGAVTFGATAAASESAADILVAMATDPFIGNRATSELDLVGIYTTIAAIQTYFGTSLCTNFCYTFDDSRVSFEESASDLAAAIFCVAYRRGNVITLSFEKQTAASTLLFNHRNKLPRSETRTVTFGRLNDYDGITLEYIEPNAPNFPNVDTPMNLYFPADQSAVNPKKITLAGVRNNVQAFLLGWRMYQKLLYQNTATSFNALSEAATCVVQDRILVADNTRSDTQDGEVIGQNALEIELSQPVTFVGGLTYTIFLQHYDGTIESLAITAGSGPTKVLLATAPAMALCTDPTLYARTTYMIVSSAPQRANAFLISEKTPQDGQTFEIKATNYDDRYYSHDTDFINGLVLWNGEGSGDGGALPLPGSPGGAPAGTHYSPTVVNDFGFAGGVDGPNGPSFAPSDSGLTATSGTVSCESGQESVHFTGGSFFDQQYFHDGEVVWSGFQNVVFAADTTLHILCSITGSASGGINIHGNTSVTDGAGQDITFNVPAGTNIASLSVDISCTAMNDNDSSSVVVTNIYIA